MTYEVRMPQLGESITEGTVVRWLKEIGDRVERDEPLLEISTDKVDSEVPSPKAGWVAEILVPEGETVPVQTPVCRLSEAPVLSAKDERSGSGAPAQTGSAERTSPSPASVAEGSREASSKADGRRSGAYAQESFAAAAPSTPSGRSAALASGERTSTERLSPAVWRLVRDHRVDLRRIRGTGEGGRITRRDVEAFLARGPTVGLPPGAVPEDAAAALAPGDRIEPLSVMRRQIAEHMVESIRAAPHVATVHEVDLTAVGHLRAQLRSASPGGPRWTWLAFILHAVARSLREFEMLNASLADGRVHYHAEVRLGVAVALNQGLIVPVIRRADQLSVRELTLAIEDIAERARTRRFLPV